jgi:hypothetical protein
LACAIKSCTVATGKLLTHDEHVGDARQHGDRLEAGRIEIELAIERAVDRERRGRRREQRVAVCVRLEHQLGADIAAGARAVLDDERLPEPGVQLLRNDACRRIDAAAGGDVDDDPHRPVRVGRCAVLAGRRRRHEQ